MHPYKASRTQPCVKNRCRHAPTRRCVCMHALHCHLRIHVTHMYAHDRPHLQDHHSTLADSNWPHEPQQDPDVANRRDHCGGSEQTPQLQRRAGSHEYTGSIVCFGRMAQDAHHAVTTTRRDPLATTWPSCDSITSVSSGTAPPSNAYCTAIPREGDVRKRKVRYVHTQMIWE